MFDLSLFIFCIFFLSPAVTCSTLDAPANGHAPYCNEGEDLGSLCLFRKCRSGYGMMGEVALECIAKGAPPNGTWDNAPPSCIGNVNYTKV